MRFCLASTPQTHVQCLSHKPPLHFKILSYHQNENVYNKPDQKIFTFGRMASNFVQSTFFCFKPQFCQAQLSATQTSTSTWVEFSITFVSSDHPPGIVVEKIYIEWTFTWVEFSITFAKLNSNFNYNFNLSWV